MRMCLLVCLVPGVMAATGCASGGAKPDRKAQQGTVYTMFESQRARYGSINNEGLGIQSFDLNEDGKPDQFRYTTADGNVVRVERDLNFNGRIDMWQYFDDVGNVIEEEIDLDLDGKVDLVVFYNLEGIVTRKLLALNFDGRPAIEKFYGAQGQLLRLERDESGDGQTDVWEYYDNGRRVRIGWDTTQDGKPDTFDQLQ